jgi:DNA-binding response OmpR family regulator
VLSQAGFRVSVIGDSSKVVPWLRGIVCDIVLLDNWMPGMTGIDLCRQIRSFDQSIPIFLCSGAAAAADKASALAAGAQGYLSKPFNPNELVSTLRAALKTSKKQSG